MTPKPWKFISEIVKLLPLTDSTYATWPYPLSRLTMIAPPRGVAATPKPSARAAAYHSRAFPDQAMLRREETYQVHQPHGNCPRVPPGWGGVAAASATAGGGGGSGVGGGGGGGGTIG